MKANDFGDLFKFYRVVYDGKVMFFPFDTEGSEKVTELVEEAEKEHVRVDVRYKRMRLICYFDYDRPATSGVDADVISTSE